MKLETVTTQQCEGVVGWCHAVAAPFMCANGIVYVLTVLCMCWGETSTSSIGAEHICKRGLGIANNTAASKIPEQCLV